MHTLPYSDTSIMLMISYEGERGIMRERGRERERERERERDRGRVRGFVHSENHFEHFLFDFVFIKSNCLLTPFGTFTRILHIL